MVYRDSTKEAERQQALGDYSSSIEMQSIGVRLIENGEEVTNSLLLQGMIGEGEKFQPGKIYTEAIAAYNSGAINQWCRATIYKCWLDVEGNKVRTLSPDLINLNIDIAQENGWLLDEEATTPERTVMYYSRLLNTGGTTPNVIDTLSIDPAITQKVSKTVTNNQGGSQTITTSYEYSGYTFKIEVKIDAVQEHHGEDAILSSWGRRVSINNGILSLK